ncbi:MULTISPECIES: TetR/AcrR family transcriptional regulator [unclassified Crossiella]|uniref:TetR/AcrR family transcriptional regulator n=1 Tax=unclassified Crossiella TaxID=2620835 RepID=UPI001FFF751F|nr:MULTISPECIES: TetR/AcrR family transcriptional regulator [unclassified Crossiella]MCK2242000.1 TetR/AcrR family transcriptional regulator [Crossiella sp. S99.2]MCK2255903.1 TetR/AcrR family transcriptional regulator [Crossiella sp. S99.1]
MGAGPVARRDYAGRSAADRRAQRRDRMLAAGLELFGTEGYAAASIERLCAQAAVSTRNFYEEFGSREALLMALHDRVNTAAIEAVRTAFARLPEAGLVERTQLAVHTYLDATAHDPRLARVAYVEVVGVSAEVERYRAGWRERWIDLLEAEAHRAVDRGEAQPRDFRLTAIALMGAVNELVHHWSVLGGNTPIEDITKEIARIATSQIQH